MRRTYPKANFAFSACGTDLEVLALILLSVQALLRGDQRMMAGLLVFLHMEGPDPNPGCGTASFVPSLCAILNQLRIVCSENEVEDWGRLLALALLARNRVNLDARWALVRRRCAN